MSGRLVALASCVRCSLCVVGFWAMVNVEFSNMYSYVDPMDSVVAGNIFVPAERPKIRREEE